MDRSDGLALAELFATSIHLLYEWEGFADSPLTEASSADAFLEAHHASPVAMLERADQGIGRILQVLRSRGLERNTLVIYMQDNGGEWLSRNAPLSNRKGTVWEGGIRVPAVFKWPARLPAGRMSNQVGIVQDVTASILAATGTAVPSQARPDGMNLMPILEGRTAPWSERCSSDSRLARPSRLQSARAPGSCWWTVRRGTSSTCRRTLGSAMISRASAKTLRAGFDR